MRVYPKNVEASPEAMANYAMVSMMMGSLSKVSANAGTDAVLYYPGVFDTDMSHRMNEWWQNSLPRLFHYVLVAGHHAEAGQHAHLTEDALKHVFEGRTTDPIHSQVHAAHTGEQASWSARMFAELDLEVIELYVPAFHLPRAYLTTVKALNKADIQRQVLLLPRALPMNPDAALPMVPPFEDGFYTQAELVGGEAKKMLDYTADVASLAELKEYLALHL